MPLKLRRPADSRGSLQQWPGAGISRRSVSKLFTPTILPKVFLLSPHGFIQDLTTGVSTQAYLCPLKVLVDILDEHITLDP